MRALCKKASISRSWYILACEASQDCDMSLNVWVKHRKDFILAWEKSNNVWLEEIVTQAVQKGDIAIWKLFNGMSRSSLRPLVKDNGTILTDPSLIANELSNFHQRSLKEISSIPPGEFDPVRWDEDFILKDSPEADLVLEYLMD